MVLENYWKQDPIYFTAVLVDHSETKMDVFDAQVNLNCDILINKILTGFSQLPLQYSI